MKQGIHRPRVRAVRAVRRSAQAAALLELEAAETRVGEIESRLAELDSAQAALTAATRVPSPGDETRADRLAAGSRAHQQAVDSRRRITDEVAGLGAQLVAAGAKVEAAREAVGNATRALRRIEDLDSS